VTFDLDVHDFEQEERVRHYVRLFTGSARGTFTEWLGRGSRYDAMIRAKLRAGGLPEDLRYLPLVESGYDVHAVSRASAVGMWQFMAPTARDVGLRVDWWVDERRDPVRATDGAVRMLRWLKSEFGSFFVAAAAYNGGPGRVSRGLAQLVANSDSAMGDARFFSLVQRDYLRAETKNYVPQLIAAALIGNELPRYRITARDEAAFAYDSVTVPPLTPLAAVARAASATRAQLLDLNPHLLRGLTPPDGRGTVRVPVGAADGFQARFAKLSPTERRAFRRVVTKRRDQYSAIASREDVPASLVAALNPSLTTVTSGKYRGRIVSGQSVRLPTASVLAYARGSVADAAADDGPGALPALPEEPKVEPKPEPEPEKVDAKRKGARAADDARSEKTSTPSRESKSDKSERRTDDAADEPKPKRADAKAKSSNETPAKDAKAVKEEKSARKEADDAGAPKSKRSEKKGAAKSDGPTTEAKEKPASKEKSASKEKPASKEKSPANRTGAEKSASTAKPDAPKDKVAKDGDAKAAKSTDAKRAGGKDDGGDAERKPAGKPPKPGTDKKERATDAPAARSRSASRAAS
jgi:membrane-bound lytic murein transglycosylase D